MHPSTSDSTANRSGDSVLDYLARSSMVLASLGVEDFGELSCLKRKVLLL